MIADEVEDLVLDLDAQRDAEAAADIFLEPGRTAETLGGVNHLREAAVPAVDPGPELAAGALVLGDADRGRDEIVARGRQRRADQPRQLGQQPAATAEAAFHHFPGIEDRAALGDALAEAAAGGRRQAGPVRLANQRAEAKIADLG